MSESLTPGEMLEIWGLVTVYGRLKSAGPRSSFGGATGMDEGAVVKRYVEGAPLFDESRPVLLWHYGYGQPLAAFDPLAVLNRGLREANLRLPLERQEALARTPREALMRLGWGFLLGVRTEKIGEQVLERFLEQMVDRLRREPYVPPAAPVEDELEAELWEAEGTLRDRYFR